MIFLLVRLLFLLPIHMVRDFMQGLINLLEKLQMRVPCRDLSKACLNGLDYLFRLLVVLEESILLHLLPIFCCQVL